MFPCYRNVVFSFIFTSEEHSGIESVMQIWTEKECSFDFNPPCKKASQTNVSSDFRASGEMLETSKIQIRFIERFKWN